MLDTHVVSEQRNLRVDRADANVALWADSVDAVDLEVSAITVFDDHRRAARSGATRCRVQPYARGRTGRCCPRSQGAFLSVGVAVAARSALFHVPDPRPIRNAPIAAAALVHRIIVVARSGHHRALRRDYWERVGTVNDLTLNQLVAGLDKIKHSVQRHSGSGSRGYDVFIKPLMR